MSHAQQAQGTHSSHTLHSSAIDVKMASNKEDLIRAAMDPNRCVAVRQKTEICLIITY